MKCLLAGFEGENNSAKILLDKLSSNANTNKLYLKNNFEKCAFQITAHIQKGYDFIIAFGQKPIIKSIYIEKSGYVLGRRYVTSFQYESLKEFLVNKKYKVKISDNAGNYLCNHVYGTGLSYIEQQKLTTEYIFIHLPFAKNIIDMDGLANTFNEYMRIYTE